jgi:hypothetical protein
MGFERYRVINGAHPIGTGTQEVYRFPNGYGASVVQFPGSYGYSHGLWELAVLKFYGEGNDFDLCYNTGITSDVIGYLDREGVDSYLQKIKDL